MSTLKRVILKNFQSHTESLYEFNKTGVNIIKGPNGNGKSVLIRALKYTLNPDPLYFRNPSHRKGKIKRGEGYAFVYIEFYDELIITLTIREEASETYYTFSDIPDTKLYISKDRRMIQEKLENINLHSMSIQLFKDKIPFIDGDGINNLKIVEKAINDKVADTIKDNASETIIEWLQEKKTRQFQLEYLQGKYDGMRSYKIDRIKARIELLEKLEEAMSNSLPISELIGNLDIPDTCKKYKLYNRLDNIDIDININKLYKKRLYRTCSYINSLKISKRFYRFNMYKHCSIVNENITIPKRFRYIKQPSTLDIANNVNIDTYLECKDNVEKIKKGICPMCRKVL